MLVKVLYTREDVKELYIEIDLKQIERIEVIEDEMKRAHTVIHLRDEATYVVDNDEGQRVMEALRTLE